MWSSDIQAGCAIWLSYYITFAWFYFLYDLYGCSLTFPFLPAFCSKMNMNYQDYFNLVSKSCYTLCRMDWIRELFYSQAGRCIISIGRKCCKSSKNSIWLNFNVPKRDMPGVSRIQFQHVNRCWNLPLVCWYESHSHMLVQSVPFSSVFFFSRRYFSSTCHLLARCYSLPKGTRGGWVNRWRTSPRCRLSNWG